MGRRSRWFAGVADVELLFPRYDRANRYVVHNCYYPCPSLLARTRFDAVLLMSTFIDWVAREGLHSQWLRQYAFLRDGDAMIIAFPQDDYWYCEVRDAFYTEWGVELVFPVCPPESWPELLPRYLATGRTARQGYTTYVTDYTRALVRRAQPWATRRTDVVYRATKHPKAPNHYGIVKGVIGERFMAALPPAHGLRLDLSTEPRDLIRGDAWYDFIGGARAILGSNSGSSIRLRNYAVLEEIARFRTEHPTLPLDRVEQEALPPADRDKAYTAISPRNLEAAALGTVQVLVPGPYSGLMKAGDHFIALEEDARNTREVLAALADAEACAAMTSRTRTALLEAPALQAETLIATVDAAVRSRGPLRRDPPDLARVSRRYRVAFVWTFARQLPLRALRAVAHRVPGLRRLVA
jgi:hypothetical protein